MLNERVPSLQLECFSCFKLRKILSFILKHTTDRKHTRHNQSYLPPKSIIDLLKASIRDALSENALSLSIPSGGTGDPELNDHLRQLSTQIHDKSNEIVASISTILYTFDLATPLPPASSGLAHLNELLLGYNDEVVSPSVQFDGVVWMQDLSNEVSAIETWEENANNLSLLVMSDFDARRKTSAVEEDAVA